MNEQWFVFRLFFSHLGSAVLLALAVMCSYYVAHVFSVASSKLFFEFPLSMAMSLRRWQLGVPHLRRQLGAGVLEPKGNIDLLAMRLDVFLGQIERRLERLRSGKQPVAAILFDPKTLAGNLKSIESHSMRLLES